MTSPAPPGVTERTEEEIAAIWERCQAEPDGPATASVASTRAGSQASPDERDHGPHDALSKEKIRSGIELRIDEVRVCFEQALATSPSLSGRLQMKFVIAGDGSVVQAKVIDAPTDLSDVGSCIVERMRQWTFPPPSNGGVVVVEYPLVLERDDSNQAASDSARPVFDAHLNDFRRCYARARLQSATAAGVVGIRVELAPTGKVLRATPYRNDTQIRELGCCVATVARSYRFAEHAGGPCSVTYAVKFDPKGP